MKIGIISTTGNLYNWAGSEETWRILADYLLDNGHKVRAIIPQKISESTQVAKLVKKGGDIYARGELNSITRKLAVKKRYSRFRKFLKKKHDILFVSTGGINDCAWIPDLYEDLKQYKGPIVYFIQSNEEGAISDENVRERLRKLYSRGANFIFLSNHNKSLAERQLAIKFHNSEIVMNPLRQRVDCPLKWPDEKVYKFAEVARFEVRDKQQDHLIEALSTDRWKSRNWQLTFYGSGPDQAHIEKLIHFFGLNEKISIGGYVSNFTEIWDKEHIHILPSRREGMPLSLIESMACGRPALVTHAGGSSELVDNGVNGFICPGMHPQVLRDSLEQAWSQRYNWEVMGLNAAEKIDTVVKPNWAQTIFRILEDSVTEKK